MYSMEYGGVRSTHSAEVESRDTYLIEVVLLYGTPYGVRSTPY